MTLPQFEKLETMMAEPIARAPSPQKPKSQVIIERAEMISKEAWPKAIPPSHPVFQPPEAEAGPKTINITAHPRDQATWNSVPKPTPQARPHSRDSATNRSAVPATDVPASARGKPLSNKQKISQAIEHVCLAGPVNAVERKKVLDVCPCDYHLL